MPEDDRAALKLRGSEFQRKQGAFNSVLMTVGQEHPYSFDLGHDLGRAAKVAVSPDREQVFVGKIFKHRKSVAGKKCSVIPFGIALQLLINSFVAVNVGKNNVSFYIKHFLFYLTEIIIAFLPLVVNPLYAFAVLYQCR